MIKEAVILLVALLSLCLIVSSTEEAKTVKDPLPPVPVQTPEETPADEPTGGEDLDPAASAWGWGRRKYGGGWSGRGYGGGWGYSGGWGGGYGGGYGGYRGGWGRRGGYWG